MLRNLLTVVAAALGLSSAPGPATQMQPADMGRELRRVFLASTSRGLGLAPTPEYPKVFAAAMDWPLDDHVATVVSIADGNASIYTTSTFGIIGGINDAKTRQAAQRFVREAQSHFERATPVTSFPYPAKTSVRFYLLGYDGVRFVEGGVDAIMEGTAPLSPLFGAAQDVITELHQRR